MKVIDYPSFRKYFSDLAFSNPDLAVQGDGRAFVWYDDDIKLHYERSEAAYPILELERPTIVATMIKGGNHSQTWSCAFSILTQASPDDFDAQESALETCEQIMSKILSRINMDRIFNGLDFRLNPIRNVMNDSLWGWGCEWTMDVPASYCWDSQEWRGIHRMKPIWTGGETVIELVIDSTTFQAPWTSEADIAASLTALSAAITPESYVDEGTIVILADKGSVHTITPGVGHSWQYLTIWPSL